MPPSLKGRDAQLQRSHVKLISPPRMTHSSYSAIEMAQQRTCVHLAQESHEMALDALVTPLSQTTQGLETLLRESDPEVEERLGPGWR